MAYLQISAMRKTIRVILFVSIVMLVVTAGFWLKRQLAIDTCLDGGGRWNYSLSQCEKK